MSDAPSDAAAPPPPPSAAGSSASAMSTSTLGSAPQRKRHRDDHVQYAYTIQREAGLRGMLIWTIAGASTVFMAHHLFPLVRRQTLAGKAFLTSGFTIFGLCTGAESVLQHHETQQRSEENLIRDRARAELGRRGVVASEAEIERWRTSERDKLIERLRREREEQRRLRDVGKVQQEREQQEAVKAVGQVETEG
ncbi:hypothetical protein BDZ90DRAFT_231474 [Jaminaea rosea]|uniref:Uncharacterized protein n=1 Tax=Jaminaea rosea TaxID=1569628 RepID=A0A316UT75_9BASI|nr:hypothetical protein BDZ90DRAFT_231474 [Jaminaea rosea]PWN28487.1 hypothetical protein BDZ90DRAFT_231474 [Jaminaea rosea]